jgi:hypothetical protein
MAKKFEMSYHYGLMCNVHVEFLMKIKSYKQALISVEKCLSYYENFFQREDMRKTDEENCRKVYAIC